MFHVTRGSHRKSWLAGNKETTAHTPIAATAKSAPCCAQSPGWVNRALNAAGTRKRPRAPATTRVDTNARPSVFAVPKRTRMAATVTAATNATAEAAPLIKRIFANCS